ncbi:MAG: monovalent cation/H(+) antiporter subunit G [Anaerolineae bacterium]|nr:monovalent cation/H(+) antiporter subunit G [Anaerolineae bacterium]
METLQIALKIVAIVFIVVGSIFSSIGMLGVTRLPDVYTRLHATGKVSAFGAVFLLGAATIVLWRDLTIFKSLILIVFLLLASPVVAHTIASAAYKSGLPMAQATRDDLAEVLPRGSGKNV